MPEPMRDVVIVLPGITGSVLQKGGKDLWAVTAGSVLRGLISGGKNINELALGDDPPDVEDLGDGVIATALFPDTHLVPGLWKIDGYSKITRTIRRTFDLTAGRNYFEFPYDWRRDNRVAAKKLERDSLQWLKTWREQSGNADARLVFIAHSMGGLVARYFLEVLEGWRHTRALITFGTPYRGSLNALNFIVNGYKKSLGPVSLIDLSAVLRSMTSVYQLLPIYPCVDSGDGKLVRVAEAKNIPNLDRAKSVDALKFHHEIRDAVASHQSDPEYRDNGYHIFPIVGTHQETLQSARLSDGLLQLAAEYEGRDLGGDGTVPRVSATPIELGDERREMFDAQKHGSLQNSDAVLVQLEGVLKSFNMNLNIFRGRAVNRRQIPLRLVIDDAYEAGEPVRVRVRPEEVVPSLSATIQSADSAAKKTLSLQPDSSGWYVADHPPLDPGTYRISVSGPRAVTPVSDVFLVA